MSKTRRNKPHGTLTEREKKLAEKNKFHSPVMIKGEVVEHYSANAKKEAKKEKHRKQRIETSKEIKSQLKDKDTEV
jgi:hypothetical protein